jgi:hypothetical protein
MVDVQGTQSTVTLRSGRSTDTTACGRICYEAFEAIARQHNFAPDFPSVEITGHKTRSMYRRYRIVDERDLREATERLQSHLESQDGAKVVPLRASQ